MSAPQPGNSSFTDAQIADLPELVRSRSQALHDMLSQPMDDMDPKEATTQFWFCPETGLGYNVVWARGRWWREGNGSRREVVGPGGFSWMDDR